MTVHFISVGVSLLDSLEAARERQELKGHAQLVRAIRDRRPQHLLADQLIATAEEASDWLARALTSAPAPFPADGPAGLLLETCAAVHPGLWAAGLSAELDTFARAPGSSYPLHENDIAVLISSNTAVGLLAGLWNAAALVGGDLGRVCYLAEPGDPLTPSRGRAVLLRIPGLDTGDDSGFAEAMTGLGRFGRNLRDGKGISPDEPFRFYLSGGFKAAIPYLIGLAEGLRSLDERRDVSAWVLHDATRSAAIRLPLRRLVMGTVQSQLEGFGPDGTRRDPPGSPAVLEGYAYEKEQGGKVWRLTPFGRCLIALFGPGAEGLRR